MNENELRSKLAKKLNLIEQGLKLVKEEYHIPKGPCHNSAFIDILAKDELNKFVIIELKKNNQSARQALHELFKYTALFSNQHNVNKFKIRTLLVSVEWDELLIPFSEYIKTTECQTTGYHLLLDDKDEIKCIDKIQPLEQNLITSVFGYHYIYLFQNEIERDKLLPSLIDIIKNCRCNDFILLIIDYKGNKSNSVYPHAIYMVPIRIDIEIENELKRLFIEEYEEEPEDPLQYQDQFIANINEKVHEIKDVDFSGEIGYPEKFVSVLGVQEWKVDKILRFGCYENNDLISDKEIERMISGVEGNNIHHFNRIANTSDQLDWKNTREKVNSFLEGTSKWEKAFEWFSKSFCDDAHFISNAIYEAAVNNDIRYFPQMEITSFNETTSEVHSIFGFVEWNDKISLTHFNHIYNSICESFDKFLHYCHFGQSYIYDEKLVTAHGLEYVCVYWNSIDDNDSFLNFTKRSGKIISKHINRETKPLIDYFENNRTFIYTVIEGMDQNICRIS